MVLLKKMFIPILASVFAVMPASAHTVSVMILETGIREGAPAVEASNLWESGLMDTFFEEGHIVSNAQALRISAKPEKDLPDEILGDYNEAIEGGAEYFILALLDYQGNSGTGILKPRQVSLRLFRTHPFQYMVVVDKQYSGSGTAPVGEELANAKKAALKMVPHLR